MSSGLGGMVAYLRANNDDFNKKMDAAPKKIQAVGKVMTGIGAGLTAGITLPLIGVGAAAITAGNDFNAGLANVQSLIPGNVAEVQKLGASIQQVSIETGKFTDDTTAGMYQVVSAFGDTADTAKILEINAKAAVGGVAEVSDAINLTSAVTKAYGDTTAKAVQHAADLATLTVRLGQTTFPELASSIGQVTALGSNLKISQEQLFAAFAATSGVVGTASQVATDLKGDMQALLAPTASMQDLFKKVGVSSGQALIKQYGLAGAMKQIVQYAKDTKQPLQALIGSVEGQTLALSLAGPQGKAFADNLKQMQGAAGASQAAFDAQTNGVNKAGFSWQQAQVKMQVFLQQAGNDLAPVIIKVIGLLTPLIGFLSGLAAGFSTLSGPAQVVIGVLLGLAAAAGPVLVVAGQLIGAAAGIATAFGAEGALAGVAGLLGPIGLVIAGIVALVAAIALIVTHWQQISAAIQSNPVFQFLAEKIFPAVVASLQSLGTTIQSQVQPILAQLQTVLQTQLLPAWNSLQKSFDAAKPVLAVIAGIIGGVLLVALGLLVGVLNGVFSALGPVLGGIISLVAGVLQAAAGVVQTVVGIFQVLVGLVKGIFTGDWTTLQDGLGNIGAGVLNIVQGLIGGILGLFGGLVGGVVGFVSGLVGGVIGFFQNLWETLVGHSIIPDLVNGILTWIGSLPGKALAFISKLVTDAIAGFFLLRNLAIAHIAAFIVDAQTRFSKLVDILTRPIRDAKDQIGKILGDLGGLFSKLKLSLPAIKLPHFSINGSFSLNPPSIPTVGVNWYAKGGIVGLNGPQIIGVGDAGPEAIVPLDRLGSTSRSETPGDSGSLAKDIARALVAALREAGMDKPTMSVDGRSLTRALLPHMVNEIRNSAGIRAI